MNEIWVIAIAAGFVIFISWVHWWTSQPRWDVKRFRRIHGLWNEKQRIMGALSMAGMCQADRNILQDRVKDIEAELWDLGVIL